MRWTAKDIMLLLLSSVLVSSNTANNKRKARNNMGNDNEAEGEQIAEAAVISDMERSAPQKDDIHFEHKWSFWFENKLNKDGHKRLNKADYLNQVAKAGTFDTVPSFWNCWNEVQQLCKASNGGNYLVFKHGIKPVWEDPKNIKGGKCVLVIPKNSHEEPMKQWVTLMLSLMIGEFEAEINGAVLSHRPWGTMFAIWTRTSDRYAVDTTCKKLHEIFGDVPVKFQRHQATIRKFTKVRGMDPNSTSNSSSSEEEQEKTEKGIYNGKLRRKSVVTEETKGMLHNLIAEVMESPIEPPINHSSTAKEVSPMSSQGDQSQLTSTIPGIAGHAVVQDSITSHKKLRRNRQSKGEEPFHNLQHDKVAVLHTYNRLSIVQKVTFGILLLAGGVITSALSWLYL